MSISAINLIIHVPNFCMVSFIFHEMNVLIFQNFAMILQDESVRRGYETEIVDLKTYEPEDDLDSEVSGGTT